MDYTLKLVEWTGANWNVVATIALPAFQQPLTEALNGMGSTAIQISPNDPDHAPFYTALATDWPAREIQVFRGAAADPLWWGTPTDPAKNIGSDVLTVVLAESIPWWLQGLHFGRAQRDNLLTDPNFDSGAFAPNWDVAGIDTATVESTGLLRNRSARLTNTPAEDKSVSQSFSFTAGGIGNNISVAAHYMVESAGFVEGNYANRGLYAEWLDGSSVVQQTASVPLNTDSLDVWQRAEIPLGSLWIPPNQTVTINTRGYTVDGTVRWGAFFVGLMESFSWTTYAAPGDTGADLALLLAGMANHAQDPAFDKVDLGIATAGGLTGGVYAFVRQFAEHANIWTNGVMDLIVRDEGIDVGWDYTANSRTLRSYSRVGAATGKGADRTALDMSLGGAYVLDYGWRKPAGQAATSVVQLGQGDGPDREEQGYIDTTGLGGRVREYIATASADATIDDLDERAARIGAVKAKPRQLYLALRPGVAIQGGTTLLTGDRVTLPAYDAHVAGGVYRVVQRSINPRADMAVLTVEPIP